MYSLITFNKFLKTFSNNFCLESSRVRLTPLTLDHVEDLDKIAYDPAMWNLIGYYVQNKKDLEDYIKAGLEHKKACFRIPLAVFDKTVNRYVGKQIFITSGSTSYYEPHEPMKRIHIGYTWYGT